MGLGGMPACDYHEVQPLLGVTFVRICIRLTTSRSTTKQQVHLALDISVPQLRRHSVIDQSTLHRRGGKTELRSIQNKTFTPSCNIFTWCTWCTRMTTGSSLVHSFVLFVNRCMYTVCCSHYRPMTTRIFIGVCCSSVSYPPLGPVDSIPQRANDSIFIHTTNVLSL